MKGFLVTGMVLALSACAANNRYCLGNQPYDDAVSVPILHPADGLQMPHVAGAFVVPPPVKDGVPFGKQTKGADGKSTIACLDQPPAIPAPQGDSISVPTRHD
ncbi:MAG: hypothetical protein EPN72_13435 [Nevskiaceae bacterium]|nr:MAG: hypothetical protein EPN63_13765 [Nevskiaceae bacterium]TBR71471.1 MAG: hypothetical protein EPN72_13435 [Nevskiaceae bacterium]